MNADIFQLQEGVILLDVLHRVDNKTLQHLNVLVLNTNNVLVLLARICQLHRYTLQ